MLGVEVPLSGILAVGIPFPVHSSVTGGAKCHEIFFRILAELAARFDMMHLQILGASAGLAAPAITPQDFLPQLLIGLGFETFSLEFCQGSFQPAAPSC
jgi:hypothetical protein